MAVLVEALSVVIRCEALASKYIGGTEAFVAAVPNKTLCADGELAAVSFMVPTDVRRYVECLQSNGLTYKSAGVPIDLVVVDQLRGPTSVCGWIEFGTSNWNDIHGQTIAVCRLKGAKIDRVVVPHDWAYKGSLSTSARYIDRERIPENLKFLESENGVDVLVDEGTGQKFYVRRV